MPKFVEKPKKYIVSCRVNDQEMEALVKLAQRSRTNISELLRRSLEQLPLESPAGERARA